MREGSERPRGSNGARERGAFETALARVEGCPVRIVATEPCAPPRRPGQPTSVVLRYRARGTLHHAVFHTYAPDWYGHDLRADRANSALLAADTFREQPRHVRVLDVGATRHDELVSLRDTGEFYFITGLVEGATYDHDLLRIADEGIASPADVQRARVLARHIAEVHCAQPASCRPEVYTRFIRDTIGSGGGIFGVIDSFPEDFPRRDLLERIEKLAVAWRWRVGREYTWRLRRVHGAFTPDCVVFRSDTDFTVTGAARGSAGEPADDLAAMSLHFVAPAMRHLGTWERGFKPLWTAFFDTYLDATGDEGALEQIGLFLAWRSVILASAASSPDLGEAARVAHLENATRWLETRHFAPAAIEADVPLLDVPRSALSKAANGSREGRWRE